MPLSLFGISDVPMIGYQVETARVPAAIQQIL